MRLRRWLMILTVGVGLVVAAPAVPATAATTGWLEVSAGTIHSCAIRSDRTLWCWGRNDTGQLGLGDTTTRTAPRRVVDEPAWRTLTAGPGSVCGIRADGTLWCWGEARYAGAGGTEEILEPLLIAA
ncbi:hypothetical protein [Dactylosporangium sp. NPDC005555]|uniref:hypothetical protein n=1 Tax=Dactylosporangium sp. NPDC005555 TaxID=3154889 RepID=UPI0033B7E24E